MMKNLLIGGVAAAAAIAFAPLAQASPNPGDSCNNWHATTQGGNGQTLYCTHREDSGLQMYWEPSIMDSAYRTSGFKTAPGDQKRLQDFQDYMTNHGKCDTDHFQTLAWYEGFADFIEDYVLQRWNWPASNCAWAVDWANAGEPASDRAMTASDAFMMPPRAGSGLGDRPPV